MADKTDDLLISVSTDLSTIKRQLKQLGQDVGQATTGVQKQFDAMGKGIDQSLTPIQKRINAMVGIPVASKVKEWKGALAEVENTSKLTANQLLNLSRQGNDVVTMFALGAKPMQIFASQAGQVFDALQSGPAGAMGSIKAIGEGAISLATKFPLVTAAIAAAGVAFIAYEAVGGSNIRTLDEILKDHEANIKRLGDAYDEVAGKQKKYAADTARTVNALNEGDQKDLANKLGGQVKAIFDEIYKTIGAGGGNQGPLSKTLVSTFEPFRAAIEKLAEGARNGAPDVKAFRDEITAIAAADPRNLNSARDYLLGLSSAAADTAAALPSVSGAVSDAVDTVDAFNRALSGLDSKPAQKELQDLFDKAQDGTVSLDDIKAALARLEQANPDFSSIIASIGQIVIAARNASAAVSQMYAGSGNGNGRVYNPLAAQVDDAVARGANIVPTPAPNREDLGAAYDKAVAAAQRKADAAARRANRAQPKTADDRFAEDLQSIRDRTAALTEEYNALGLSYEEQTKRKTALDLEQQALKQVREEARKKGDADWQNAQLTPQQIAQIDAVSEAYARQADALKKAQEMQQLQQDLLKGAFDDLRSALDDGKLDWQDFQKIALNALDKIIDKIENDLIDSIMQANSATGGGGGGLLGWLIGGSGGGSSNVFPGGGVLNSTGGLYDSGGYTGPGGKKDVAGLVHKGEVVFSQDDIARNGGVAAVEAMRRGRAIAAPQMPSINAPAVRGGDTSVTFAPSISVQGGGGDAGEQVTAALKKFEREFTPKVVKALKEAKTRGMVA